MKHYARSRAWCEWAEFDAWHARALASMSDPDAAALPPFHLLSLPGISAAQQRQCAERWMDARLAASAGERSALAHEFAGRDALRPEAFHKIRIGYLSRDFQDHATAWLLIEALEACNHHRFELHAYSYGADDRSGLRQRLQIPFHRFTDISAMSDQEAARGIHDDRIDILVDLKGYTSATRTALLSYRPAPVQVSYLGYPGTLGESFCDYLISDDFVTPAGSDGDYTESLARMPHSYQPHGRPALSGVPAREALGLPPDAFVYCCFNQAYKFTPDMFDVWCRLLESRPDSVLWLLEDVHAEGNLRQEAMRRGIAPHRLVFAPHRPQADHLARLAAADLALDTLPYNAHTTASDALWAGLPMVTCSGSTFASRVAGSLLHAAGMPELVTHTLDDYADLALALASDPGRLQGLRARLIAARTHSPLFDAVGYARALEGLYEAMWWRHVRGQAPTALQG